MKNKEKKESFKTVFTTMNECPQVDIGDVILINFDNIAVVLDEINTTKFLDNLESLGKELVQIAKVNKQVFL